MFDYFFSWYIQLIYFILVLLAPFALFLAIFYAINQLCCLNVPFTFLIFIALTLSSILSLFYRYGNFIIIFSKAKKIFSKAKIEASYNANLTKYLMYLTYFFFLLIGYGLHFFRDTFVVPEYATASFLIYLAFDRLRSNRHLFKIKKQS